MSAYFEGPGEVVTAGANAPALNLLAFATFKASFLPTSLMLGQVNAAGEQTETGQGSRQPRARLVFASDAAENDAITCDIYAWYFARPGVVFARKLTTLTLTVGASTGLASDADLPATLRLVDKIAASDTATMTAINAALGGAVGADATEAAGAALCLLGELANAFAITPVVISGLEGSEVLKAAMATIR